MVEVAMGIVLRNERCVLRREVYVCGLGEVNERSHVPV